MLARALALLLCLPTAVRAQLAVTDPAMTAVSQAHLQLMQLHTEFMKLQMVQDAVTLKNTYLQS